jgi:hypothetical protein
MHVVGVHLTGREVEFTRTVSDSHIAHLDDLYVLPSSWADVADRLLLFLAAAKDGAPVASGRLSRSSHAQPGEELTRLFGDDDVSLLLEQVPRCFDELCPLFVPMGELEDLREIEQRPPPLH